MGRMAIRFYGCRWQAMTISIEARKNFFLPIRWRVAPEMGEHVTMIRAVHHEQAGGPLRSRHQGVHRPSNSG